MTPLQVSLKFIKAYIINTYRLEAANDPAVQAFSSQLDAFVANPVCKGGRSVAPAKRDIPDSPGYTNALNLAYIIAGASTLTTGLDVLYSGVFDSKVGNAAGVHFGSINSQQKNFPGLDKVYIAVEAMCLGGIFGTELTDYNSANTEICIIGPGGHRMRRNIHLTDGKRNFWSANHLKDAPGSHGNPTDRPLTGGFMQQVSSGDLEVVYQRIVQLGPAQRSHMLLESTLSTPSLVFGVLGSKYHHD